MNQFSAMQIKPQVARKEIDPEGENAARQETRQRYLLNNANARANALQKGQGGFRPTKATVRSKIEDMIPRKRKTGE